MRVDLNGKQVVVDGKFIGYELGWYNWGDFFGELHSACLRGESVVFSKRFMKEFGGLVEGWRKLKANGSWYGDRRVLTLSSHDTEDAVAARWKLECDNYHPMGYGTRQMAQYEGGGKKWLLVTRQDSCD